MKKYLKRIKEAWAVLLGKKHITEEYAMFRANLNLVADKFDINKLDGGG